LQWEEEGLFVWSEGRDGVGTSASGLGGGAGVGEGG